MSGEQKTESDSVPVIGPEYDDDDDDANFPCDLPFVLGDIFWKLYGVAPEFAKSNIRATQAFYNAFGKLVMMHLGIFNVECSSDTFINKVLFDTIKPATFEIFFGAHVKTILDEAWGPTTHLEFDYNTTGVIITITEKRT